MNSNLLQVFQKKITSFFKSNKIDYKLLKMLDPTCNKKHNLKTKKKRMRHKITKKKY